MMLNSIKQTDLDGFYKPDSFPKGLTKKVVESISHIKKEPDWVLEFRLKAFQKYLEKPYPEWGFFPKFDIDIENYTHYVGVNHKKEKILGRCGSRSSKML